MDTPRAIQECETCSPRAATKLEGPHAEPRAASEAAPPQQPSAVAAETPRAAGACVEAWHPEVGMRFRLDPRSPPWKLERFEEDTAWGHFDGEENCETFVDDPDVTLTRANLITDAPPPALPATLDGAVAAIFRRYPEEPRDYLEIAVVRGLSDWAARWTIDQTDTLRSEVSTLRSRLAEAEGREGRYEPLLRPLRDAIRAKVEGYVQDSYHRAAYRLYVAQISEALAPSPPAGTGSGT